MKILNASRRHFSVFLRSIPTGVLFLSIVWSYFRPEIAASYLSGIEAKGRNAVLEYLRHENCMSIIMMLLYLASALINATNDNRRRRTTNSPTPKQD